MFSKKVLPVFVTAVLTVVLSRTTLRPPRSHFNSLNHRAWRYRHTSQLSPPREIIFNEIEPPIEVPAERLREMCANEKLNPENLLKKRDPGVTTLQFYTAPSCACPEREGVFDLGADNWPRFVRGRECIHRGEGTKLAMDFGCKYSNPKCCEITPNSHCSEKYYPVHVLTRRMPDDDDDDEGDDGEDKIPRELRDNWKFRIFNASVACVFDRD